MKKMAKICSAVFLILALASPVYAFRELTVVSTWSNLTLYKSLEKPFWGQILPQESGGKLKGKIVGTLDQLNTPGTGLLRQMENGIFDIVFVCTDYIVSDCAELAGLDLPCIAPDIQTARKIVNAYNPVMHRLFNKYFNAKVLGVCPYPFQILFANFPMANGLQDIKGKKIRASGWTTAKFIDAIGGAGVTMPFGEVPQALNRGVVDGAITGSLSGYEARWGEVTKFLYPLPIGGWDYYVPVMSNKTWNAMKPEEQEMLLKIVNSKLEVPAWEVADKEAMGGVEILTGTGAYKGKKAPMTLVNVQPKDIELAKKVLENNVLPAFAAQISPEAAKDWNNSIGAVTGLKIK